MIEWIMAHPWMTFFIVLAAIEAIENVGTAVSRVIQERVKNKR